MKTKKEPIRLSANFGTLSFKVDGWRLVETTPFGLSRWVSLRTLGNILRSYNAKMKKSSKKYPSIRYSYVGDTLSEGVRVGVIPYGTALLSIGCVTFMSNDARRLRRAALRSSKVTA